MKNPITLILLLLLVKGIYAQEKQEAVLPPEDNKIIYSNIIQVDNTSKEELYKRARKWAAYTCDVITLDDNDEIVGRGIVFLGQFYSYDISYTIKLKVKDGRYKYEIINLRVRSRSQDDGAVEYPLDDYITEMIGGKNKLGKEFNQKLIALLEKTMKTPIDDNW
jgi:hypothetical protein